MLWVSSCPLAHCCGAGSMCCSLDSSEALQGDSQDALIPPEVTAPSASGTLFKMMVHLKDLIVFRHTRVMEKGKGSQCPSLGQGGH